MNKYDDGTFRRISKAQARKLWEQGKPITIVPCKFRPDSWAAMHDYTKREPDYTFDTMICNYHYYNSSYELGYYPAFYIRTMT